MTRTESKEARVALLKMFHDRVVVGTEDGREAAVPACDYFEGMMSPGSYRVPGSGRNLEEVFTEVPPAQIKVMLNESLRIPLFELVFHDCVVSYWYWCDHNSKVLPLWDKRDLFNRLYGTPPMFLFNESIWLQYKERFAQSYQIAQPVSIMTGYEEMIDHVYLTSDMTVQQTVFSNTVRVTVNFGTQEYKMTNGKVIPGGGSLIDEVTSEDVTVSGTNPENPIDSDSKTVQIVLIVIGCFLVGVIVVLAIFCIKRKSRKPDDMLVTPLPV
jgi:hypothetical protein